MRPVFEFKKRLNSCGYLETSSEMDSLKMRLKVEPAEYSIFYIKEYSKLYVKKHSIVDKISVYSWPKNDAKQQHFGK